MNFQSGEQGSERSGFYSAFSNQAGALTELAPLCDTTFIFLDLGSMAAGAGFVWIGIGISDSTHHFITFREISGPVPPTPVWCQSSLSPGLRLYCSTIHRGTVVLS